MSNAKRTTTITRTATGWHVATDNKNDIAKFDKLGWPVVTEADGRKEYEVTNYALFFRKNEKPERKPMSDEEKRVLVERLARARQKQE